MDFHELWNGLIYPLIRLVCFISLGLMIGNLIEALNWTRAVAKLASPLIRLGRLTDISGASFSMAFFSGVAANSMLADAYEKGRLTKGQLILSNLFNALPTYFLHLPTMFFITVPFLGAAAFIYVGLTFTSAVLRTAGIIFMGRLFLPPLPEGCITCELGDGRTKGWREALRQTWKHFIKRIPRILFITVPIYTIVFFLNKFGVLKLLEDWFASNVAGISWLGPKTVSIVVFQIAAEFTAGLAVAGALLESGDLPVKQVIVALLIGNVLSSPMRALRHQFPYYAGIYKPAMALNLIIYNQTLRAASVILIGAAYLVFA